ncbi:DUF2971 domain-containing protein [Segnochrobactraceae bacterium EtOH-i3]
MDTEKLFEIFSPYSNEKINNIKKCNTKFSHYTSAAVGLEIVKNGVVWLRNASLMNDYTEITHGEKLFFDCISTSDRENRISSLLSDICPSLPGRLWNYIGKNLHQRIQKTYITCLSEHGDKVINKHDIIDEDLYGRLSMWRAYGGNQNVALVVKNIFLSSNTLDAGVFSIPVLYANEEKYADNFEKIINNIEENIDKLKDINKDVVFNTICFSIHCLIISTKHIGFSEEREWRVIHSPTIYPSNQKSNTDGLISKDTEIINGVPQPVYKLKLPLINNGAIYPNLIDSIIIGPTNYGDPIKECFVHALGGIGVPDPESKVTISGIPLRR